EGKDSRAIAEAMGLAYQTVIVHRKNIRRKLGLKKQKKNLTTYLQQM
ncbi:MAG: LuxR C-terminal-related transcriptional regulator, partial [Thermodesulfobacteriota bacterium]